jgi:poly(3-hydroxybutyrate) depolymerase
VELVLEEIRIPLAGLAAEESIVALEALAERPRFAVAAPGDILRREWPSVGYGLAERRA